MPRSKWIRYRFHANAEDYRPVKFPPPGPYWCSGYAGDDSYSIVIAYLPRDVKLKDFWPEASSIDKEDADKIVYTSRFPKPEWWDGE
jgi:hypothetical protein